MIWMTCVFCFQDAQTYNIYYYRLCLILPNYVDIALRFLCERSLSLVKHPEFAPVLHEKKCDFSRIHFLRQLPVDL